MQRYRATYSFDKLGFLKKANFALVHANKIDGSLIFINIPYNKDQIDAAAWRLHDNYIIYLTNHGDDEYDDVIAANADLSSILRTNANYVTQIAQNNKEVIESAGFVANKPREKKPKSPWSVKRGPRKGSLKFYYKKEKGVKSIVWLKYPGKIPPESIEDYKFCLGTSRESIVKGGFILGDVWCFIGGAILTNGDGDLIWSEPIIVVIS